MRVIGIPCAGSAFAGRAAAGARSVEADVGESAAGTGDGLAAGHDANSHAGDDDEQDEQGE